MELPYLKEPVLEQEKIWFEFLIVFARSLYKFLFFLKCQ